MRPILTKNLYLKLKNGVKVSLKSFEETFKVDRKLTEFVWLGFSVNSVNSVNSINFFRLDRLSALNKC